MNDNLNEVLADAERVSKGASPTVTRDEAESAMLSLAKREAREGEGTAAAFARLCESDPRMDALYVLGQAAEASEVEAVVAKADPSDRFYPLLVDLAKMHRRDGETIEAAASRLLQTDPVVRDAYAAVHGG